MVSDIPAGDGKMAYLFYNLSNIESNHGTQEKATVPFLTKLNLFFSTFIKLANLHA